MKLSKSYEIVTDADSYIRGEYRSPVRQGHSVPCLYSYAPPFRLGRRNDFLGYVFRLREHIYGVESRTIA